MKRLLFLTLLYCLHVSGAAEPTLDELVEQTRQGMQSYRSRMPPVSDAEFERMVREAAMRNLPGARMDYWFARNDLDSARQFLRREPSFFLSEPGILSAAKLLEASIQPEKKDWIELLLDNKVDPSMPLSPTPSGGSTPLQASIVQGKTNLVELFLKRGANPRSVPDPWETSPLFDAVTLPGPPFGPPPNAERLAAAREMSRLLLDAGADPFQANRPHQPATPAEQAANNPPLLELILTHPGSSGKRDRNGNTRLHFAVQHVRIKAVEALIRLGDSLESTNFAGQTPLQWALIAPIPATNPIREEKITNRTAVIHLLIKSGCKIDPLSAAALGRVDLLDQMPTTEIQDAVDAEGRTAAHWAILGNNKISLDWLAKRKLPVSKADAHRVTPLHMAVLRNQKEAALLLLELGCDPNAADDLGNTPLHAAAQNRNSEITGLLLQHGANVEVRNHSDSTPLDVASASSAPEVVKDLMAHGATISTRDLKRTLLHAALEWHEFNIAEEWLKKGISIHARDEAGKTCLWAAAARNDRQAAEWLIQHGASPNTTDTKGNTLFHALIGEMVRPSFRNPGNSTQPPPLRRLKLPHPIQESRPEDFSMIRFLAAHGGNLNLKNSEGLAPLHVWAGSGYYDYGTYRGPDFRLNPGAQIRLVQDLVEIGVDVGLRDADGRTALQIAAGRGNLEAVCALLEAGVSPNAQDRKGNSALHEAVLRLRNPGTMIDLLVANGASVQVRNRDGNTPLHLAMQGLAPQESVTVLLRYKPDVNARNRLGQTPLHLAPHKWPFSGIEEIVKALLDHSVRVDIRDRAGRTPLHYFALQSNTSPFWYHKAPDLLISAGADVNARDKDGNTPLHLCAGKSPAFVAWLIENKADKAARNKEKETPGMRTGLSTFSPFDSPLPDDLFAAIGKHSPKQIARIVKRTPSQLEKTNWLGQTPLQFAAKERDERSAFALKKAGARPDLWSAALLGWTNDLVRALKGPPVFEFSSLQSTNQPQWKQIFPLPTLVIQANQLESLRILIDWGLDVRTPDNRGCTLLLAARQKGDPRMIDLLRNAGCVESAADAVVLGDAPLLKERFAENPNLLHEYSERGVPLLLLAVVAEKPSIVEELLNRGADPDEPDNGKMRGGFGVGSTPLHYAVRQTNEGVGTLELLLAHKANPNRFDGLGYSPLHYAALLDKPDRMERLLKAGGNIEIQVQEPTRHEASNHFAPTTGTPLHLAAAFGNERVLQFLIKSGADLNALDSRSRTPLSLTMERHIGNPLRGPMGMPRMLPQETRERIRKVLIEAGALLHKPQASR